MGDDPSGVSATAVVSQGHVLATRSSRVTEAEDTENASSKVSHYPGVQKEQDDVQSTVSEVQEQVDKKLDQRSITKAGQDSKVEPPYVSINAPSVSYEEAVDVELRERSGDEWKTIKTISVARNNPKKDWAVESY
ncbi:hypothetical protein E8E12_000218, partial [Didymella heteroderae]